MTLWRCAIAGHSRPRLALAAALAALLCGCAERPRGSLSLLPIGEVPAAQVRHLRADLAGFGVPIRVRHDPVTVAPGAGQVDAEAVLAAVEALPIARGERVLALCSGDGGQRGLTFVLGLARRGGRCAVVYTHRLRAGTDDVAYRRRLATEAYHELGHAYGLGHCAQPGCAMVFSATVPDVDAKRPSYCDHCRELLGRWRRAR